MIKKLQRFQAFFTLLSEIFQINTTEKKSKKNFKKENLTKI